MALHFVFKNIINIAKMRRYF